MPSYGIHNYANREIGLTTPQVQMATFTPLEFKPQFIDPEHFKSVVDKMDAADAENLVKETAIKDAFRKRRANVHNDAKTLAMFDEQVKNYEQQIKDAVNNNGGSYHRLGRLMSNMASEAVNDTLFTALESAETQRKEWVKNNVDNNNGLSPASKRFYRWKVEQNFDNGLIYDKNDPNKVIGNKEWDSNVNVYDDLNPTQIAAVIGKITAFKRKASKDTTGAYGVWDKDAKGKIVPGSNAKENQDNITFSVTSGFEREWLSEAQLNKTFDDLYNIDPTLPHQFEAEYEKKIFEYNEFKETLNDPTKSEELKQIARDNVAKFEVEFGTPGNRKDYKHFFASKLKEYIDNQAYNRTSSVSGVEVNPNNSSDGGSKMMGLMTNFEIRPAPGGNVQLLTKDTHHVVMTNYAEAICEAFGIDKSQAETLKAVANSNNNNTNQSE